MRKYLQVVIVTLQEYFVYRLNFFLWRFRNVVQLLVLYFLWQAAVPEGAVILGYDQAEILTYVLGTSIIRSFAFSTRSVDVAGHIASGDLSNFLIKPINYLKYWFAKDVADKFLNLVFSVVEIAIVILLLRPPLLLQTNVNFLLFSFLALVIGILLYFYLSFFLSLIAFWTPESPWPLRFLFTILVEFFSGALFPLDILPPTLFGILKILPFSYFLFFPLDIYLGGLTFSEIILRLLIAVFWLLVFHFGTRLLFQKGIKTYAAWGR